MNPWVIGIVGLILGAIPSIIFYTQLSPLQRKLQQSEKGKQRAETAYNELQGEIQRKDQEIAEAKSKIPDLEAHYRSEIDNLEQSHLVQIQELQQAQAKIPDLEAQIEEMKASQVRVIELESQLAELQQLQSVPPELQISEEQLQVLQEQHQAEIQQIQQDHQGQIQALQEQHQAELTQLLESHQTQLEEIELRYQSDVETRKNTYQQQILEIQEDFETQLAQAEADASQLDLVSREGEKPHHPSAETWENEAAIADWETSPVEDQPTLIEDSQVSGVLFDESAEEQLESPLEALNELAEVDEPQKANLDVVQVTSVEEDIAGLDSFLAETAEVSEEQEDLIIPDVEASSDESSESELAEFLAETAEVSEEEEDFVLPDVEASSDESSESELAEFLADTPEVSEEEEIAELDSFLQETADFDDETEDYVGSSNEEMEFLASLQKSESESVHPELLEDEADLPDLADLSESDDAFFNMLDEDNDLPSEPSLVNSDDPFADIFSDASSETKAEENQEEDDIFGGNGQFDAFDSEKDHKNHLEGFDELFSMEVSSVEKK